MVRVVKVNNNNHIDIEYEVGLLNEKNISILANVLTPIDSFVVGIPYSRHRTVMYIINDYPHPKSSK